MPTTIVASNTIESANGQNGRWGDYTQNGNIWVGCHDESSGYDGIHFYRSTDGGANWSSAGMVGGISTEDFYGSCFFIDKDDGFHLLYYEASAADYAAYRYGTLDAGGASITWTPLLDIRGASNGTPGQGLDIVAHREGSGWKAHAFHHEYDGAAMRAYWSEITISSGGVPSLVATTEIHNWGTNVIPALSADFRHTATDAKDVQSSTPSLYVTYYETSTGSFLWYRKLTYSAGSWSLGTERTLDANAQQTNTPMVSLIYDGTRVMVVSARSATPSVVRGFERDEADTTTTSRDPTALSDGQVLNLSMGMGTNGDVWVVAQGLTSIDWKRIRFNRGSTTWGSWAVVEADSSFSGTTVCVFRGMQQSLYVVYLIIGPDPNQTRFETLVSAYDGSAFLQGVGSASGAGVLSFVGQASLQGVATVSPQAALGFNPPASLQAVATMSPTALYVPKKDFTVYDGYVDSPASGTLPLIYFEDDSAKAQTVSRPLRPPRSDTGQDPTEVRPESGEIFSQQDFSHGSGQLYYHHEGRDVRRFLWSEGFDLDVDTVGQPALLRHLHDVPAAAFTSATIGKIEVFNDAPFVIDGANIKKGSGDFPGFWTNENPGGTPQDMVSSGEFLYAALGAAGISRRDTSGAWSIWQATPLATRIAWVKNRIMASDGTTTYEITDSVRTVETLPAGWVFEAIFEAGGFIYAVANNASSGLSRISTYGLNSSGDAIEKKNETPFPRNQLMYAGRGFLGSVYIGGGIKNTSEGFDPVVYQAFPQDSGALTYLKVSEGEGAGAIDLSVKAFEPIGEDIVYGWSLGSGFPLTARDGLAIHKPKVDAFMAHLKKPGAGSGRQVLGIALFRGRLLFTLKGDGLYYEDTSTFVSQAQIISSVADWQTTSKKAWDLIQVSHNPLPAQATVRAEYATRLPTEVTPVTWYPGLLSDIDGAETAEARFTEVSSQMLSLRITSTANTARTEAPSALGFLVRSNVIPDHPEFGLTRYIRLVNKDRKDEDAPMIFTDVAAVRRKLHNLSYQWVTLYEPGVVWTLHVDSVAEVQPFLVEYDATQGEGQAQGYVVQLTMTGTRD